MVHKVLWVTNVAAPYRLPVWRRLSDLCALRVGLLHSDEQLRTDEGNRGRDWRSANATGVRIVEYATWMFARGEDRHYTLRGLRAAVDVARADAVLLGGWDSPAYWQLLAQAKITRKPTIGFYESTLASHSSRGGIIAGARRLFFSQLDRVVVPGVAARDAVLAMGVDPRRIHVGFNAVDTDAFSQADRREALGGGHRFLFVGQLIERKNISAIIDAFAAVSRPIDRLTLVGRGDQREAIEMSVRRLGIENQVDLVDFVPNKELPAVMGNHDTLVLASHVEVWGLVVNEALASGMQVVVTSNCGVAPSVRGMPGVYEADADAHDLQQVMARARDEYDGPISDPPILRQTPERFAEVFAQAFDDAINDDPRKGCTNFMRRCNG